MARLPRRRPVRGKIPAPLPQQPRKLPRGRGRAKMSDIKLLDPKTMPKLPKRKRPPRDKAPVPLPQKPIKMRPGPKNPGPPTEMPTPKPRKPRKGRGRVSPKMLLSTAPARRRARRNTRGRVS